MGSKDQLGLSEVSRRYAAAAGCEALYEVRTPDLGLVGFIALHDLTAGPGFGGIRRAAYPTVASAVRDVVALAEQMTVKTALAELPAGGAKGVVLDAPERDLAATYRAMGRAVEALGGEIYVGGDVGTSEAELRWVREATGYVNLARNDGAAATARGVVAACGAAWSAAAGSASASPGRALIQGVGAVGIAVAEHLARGGWDIAINDVSDAACASAGCRLDGAQVVPSAAVFGSDVDLLVPCGVGPVVCVEDVPRLRASVICGAANRQLADPCVAVALRDAGVSYVPDFAANAGAVIEGVLTLLSDDPAAARAAVDAAIAAIGPRVAELLAEAEAADLTPLEVALSHIRRPVRSP